MRIIELILIMFIKECLSTKLKILRFDGGKAQLDTTSVTSDDLFEFNSKVFGLKANEPVGNRPRALLIISVVGSDSINYKEVGNEYHFLEKFHTHNIKSRLIEASKNQSEHVNVDSSGIIGSNIAYIASKTPVNVEIFVSNPLVKQELLNVYKLSEAVKKFDFKKKEAVDFYRIHFHVSHFKSFKQDDEVHEVEKAMAEIIASVVEAYDKGVMVQIYSHAVSIDEINKNIRPFSARHLEKMRERYQIHHPRLPDDSVIFLINIFVVSLIGFAIVSFLWFLAASDDMGKNSIVYRLSMNAQTWNKYRKSNYQTGSILQFQCSSGSDEPIVLEKNPYTKEPRKCLLCRTGIELDYKNARLLQQFVSTFSGRVYDRHITGLCDEQQKKLLEAIAKSRRAGYMPIFVKDPKYTSDPKLFDPLRPIRPHSFA
ncbi:unnamed protein product [Caenorhabditis bovis]|uniref:Ribosomal protein S18 n=1 Tax=Caenorhabditis bovis TaxID=2654633 RepID=A0A8S1EW64_9PELO|nr:unnamed protein product [Caenorhabditis bovis]